MLGPLGGVNGKRGATEGRSTLPRGATTRPQETRKAREVGSRAFEAGADRLTKRGFGGDQKQPSSSSPPEQSKMPSQVYAWSRQRPSLHWNSQPLQGASAQKQESI